MKLTLAITTFFLSIAAAIPTTLEQRAQPKGLDVSGYQPNINWPKVKADGASFVFIKVPLSLHSFYQRPKVNLFVGNRRHILPEPTILLSVHGSHQRRSDPRGLPFCSTSKQFWCRAGKLLPRTRRWLVRRRPDASWLA